MLTVALMGCGAPPPPQQPQRKIVMKPVVDETRRFPMEGQVSIELVNDKLLGKSFLPGGNLAQYKQGNKTYQQFLVHGKSPEDAAMMMFDYKQTLRDA
ncbi:MAG: hypothetical protein HYX25_04555 [Candidatus Solibacter usitatus]|nr:hypothetical protein [Candidatus Solibacter usitatus]